MKMWQIFFVKSLVLITPNLYASGECTDVLANGMNAHLARSLLSNPGISVDINSHNYQTYREGETALTSAMRASPVDAVTLQSIMDAAELDIKVKDRKRYIEFGLVYSMINFMRIVDGNPEDAAKVLLAIDGVVSKALTDGDIDLTEIPDPEYTARLQRTVNAVISAVRVGIKSAEERHYIESNLMLIMINFMRVVDRNLKDAAKLLLAMNEIVGEGLAFEDVNLK